MKETQRKHLRMQGLSLFVIGLSTFVIMFFQMAEILLPKPIKLMMVIIECSALVVLIYSTVKILLGAREDKG